MTKQLVGERKKKIGVNVSDHLFILQIFLNFEKSWRVYALFFWREFTIIQVGIIFFCFFRYAGK